VWTAVLAIPPPAPRWLLALLVTVLALGGPASMVGFDYARTFNPSHRRGAAVGIINGGGFAASLVLALAIGVVLGLAGPGGYTPEAFRVAWTVQYAVWAIGLGGVLVARRRARRKMASEGVVVPPLRVRQTARRTAPTRVR
jgi:nitrate/nitrite transporter NarK